MEPREPMPRRPGLPLDPILQLWGGQLVALPTVTWSGGPADAVAPANPSRVALFLQHSVGAGEFTIAPTPGPCSIPANLSQQPTPYVVHCRDYPGIVQQSWVGTGMIGTQVQVWEYTLQPWWV